MSKPKHPFSSFALRLLAVLLLNGIIWTVAVQLYYQYRTSELTLESVEQELEYLEPRIREVLSQERDQLTPFLLDTMNEHAIPFLQIYKQGEGLVFDSGRTALPARLRPFPDELPLPAAPEHQLYEKGSRHYLYLFTNVFDAGWYMRTAIPVNPEFIARTRRTTNSLMLVVILTLLQVALILYPLLLASYNRNLRDRGELLMNQLWTVLALGNAIAKRDSDTDTHNYRVSYYALRLAEALNLDAARMPGLIKGAFLHDVGKIGVPDSVLLKPGRLEEREYNIIKNHVCDGLEIIEGIPWLHDAAPVIRGHHEKYNGRGYPDGLAGEAIPLEARIFSVVDVFDALTSRRSYKEALGAQSALDIMDGESGEHFDPHIYHTFKKLAPKLLKDVSRRDRSKLQRLLGRTILPYFPHLRSRHRAQPANQ